MSIKLMTEVWELELSHSKQVVMLALADHAHDDGTHCYPGVPYLAWKTGYTERNITRILSDLEADGLIEAQDEKSGGYGVFTGYHIHLEKGDKKSPFEAKSAKKRVTTQTKTPTSRTKRVTTQTDSASEKGDNSDKNPDKSDKKGDKSSINPDNSAQKGDKSDNGQYIHAGAVEPSGNRHKPSGEPLDDEPSSRPTESEPQDSAPPPPTGGLFVRLFDEALEHFRESKPASERKAISGKWRKNLRRAADKELDAGRDPELLVKAVSRLALRIDAFAGMELADAVNDVLAGKPWNVEQHKKARRVLEDPEFAREVASSRRTEGFQWLFGDDGDESNALEGGEVESEQERRFLEEEERQLARSREEEAEKRREAVKAEQEKAERVRFVGGVMAEWIREVDEKEYARKVLQLRANAERNGVTEQDVARLDEQVREGYRASEANAKHGIPLGGEEEAS